MWATAAEIEARFFETTFASYDWRVYDVFDNGEFITGATVDLIERGKVIETRSFTGSSEFEGGETGARQAISYAAAWAEVAELGLEGALQREYEREQEERGR
jgi:hypothetical protein